MRQAIIALGGTIFTVFAIAEPAPVVELQTTSHSIVIPDSIARQYFKRLPVGTLGELAIDEQKRARIGFTQARSVPGSAENLSGEYPQQLQKITVYGLLDPEDYVAPKLPPMLVFRATLDKQRPRTPQEITEGLLCVIGLCLLDTSKEPNAADRNEARAKAPPSFANQR